MHTFEELAEAAGEAHTAAELERRAVQDARGYERTDELIAWTRSHLELLVGPELAAAAEVTPDRETVWATVTIGRLRLRARMYVLYGLTNCGLCDTWNVRTVGTIADLADIGALLAGAAALEWHDTPDGAKRCNGLRMEAKPEPRPAWRVAVELRPDLLQDTLNRFAADGYRPKVMRDNHGGLLIVGELIASPQPLDDDEPF